MAATKKSLEIRAAKQALAVQIGEVRQKIVAACGRVPDRIINADAVQSVQWRDCAEAELSRCTSFPHVSIEGNSLDELNKILAKDTAKLGVLA